MFKHLMYLFRQTLDITSSTQRLRVLLIKPLLAFDYPFWAARLIL